MLFYFLADEFHISQGSRSGAAVLGANNSLPHASFLRRLTQHAISRFPRAELHCELRFPTSGMQQLKRIRPDLKADRHTAVPDVVCGISALATRPPPGHHHGPLRSVSAGARHHQSLSGVLQPSPTLPLTTASAAGRSSSRRLSARPGGSAILQESARHTAPCPARSLRPWSGRSRGRGR